MIFTLRFVQWLLTIGGKLSFCHVGKVSVRRVLLSSQILADMLLLHALWIKSGWHTAFTLQSCFVEGSLIVMWMWSLCYFICHWCRWVSWCWCIETGEEWPRDVSCERPVKFQQLPIICNDMKFLPLAMLNVECCMLNVVCCMLNVECWMLYVVCCPVIQTEKAVGGVIAIGASWMSMGNQWIKNCAPLSRDFSSCWRQCEGGVRWSMLMMLMVRPFLLLTDHGGQWWPHTVLISSVVMHVAAEL